MSYVNRYAVDTQQLDTASIDIARMSADIESQVAAMMSRLQGLSGCWQGSAAANFQQTMQHWHATQRQVRQSLEEINALLARATTQYCAVEQSNTAMFSG